MLFEMSCKKLNPDIDRSITLEKYTEIWLQTIAPDKLAKSTLVREKQDIERFKPYLGSYKLVESGKLTVGSDLDYKPMEYLDGDKPAGFGVDMTQEICNRLGLEMNFLSPQNFDSLITQVNGATSMDVAVSSITINDEREELVDFSTPYYDSNLAIVTLADSDVASASDLSGKPVGAQSGSTGEEWAKENLGDSSYTPYTGPTDALTALRAGKIQAVVLDAPVASGYVKENAGTYKLVDEIATGEQYGIAVNKDNPSYRDFLLNDETGVLPRWVRRGACGWRLDVVDELPVDMVLEMRKAVKQADPDATLLGEVWEDASNKTAYGVNRSYCLGDMLDSVMNYPLRCAVIDFFTGVIDAYQLRRVILHQQEVYPAPFYYSLMNLLGSHDRVRILNAMCGLNREGAAQMDRAEAKKITLGKRELKSAKKRYLEAMKLLCALPGAPTVYYGDEIGMTGMADPWNRAPMNWDDPDEKLLEGVRELLHKRRDNPVLQTGYLEVEAVDADTLRITRCAREGKDVFGEPLAGKAVMVKVSRK